MAVLHELMHGEKLDRGDPELGQMLHRSGMRESGVRPPDLLGDVGMPLGEAPHMGLVDHRFGQQPARRAVVAPVETGIGDHASGDRCRGIRVVAGVGLVEAMGEHSLTPLVPALDRGGMRVEQELVHVVLHSARGVPVAVDADAVARADPGAVDETVEDVAAALGKPRAGLGVAVEGADVYSPSDCARRTVPARANVGV